MSNASVKPNDQPVKKITHGHQSPHGIGDVHNNHWYVIDHISASVSAVWSYCTRARLETTRAPPEHHSWPEDDSPHVAKRV